MTLRIDVITVFPQYLTPLELSLLGRAQESGLYELHVTDLRDHTHDRHRTVDDTPYGGGPGMVMRPEPWGEALDQVLARGEAEPVIIFPTPSGVPFTQALAEEFAERSHLVIACGRYEGIDARVAEHYRALAEVREVSIGDYVLAGGEAAALVMIEAVVRLLPGVLGNSQSASDDSFAPGRAPGTELEGPNYTKPPSWRGMEVPEVLLSGDHARIRSWREEESRVLTQQRRAEA